MIYVVCFNVYFYCSDPTYVLYSYFYSLIFTIFVLTNMLYFVFTSFQ